MKVKSFLLINLLCCFLQQATAQAPQKMSYQSVIRNSSNVVVANTTVGIKISVLQGTASGTAVYVETQTATTNGNGLLSIQIGTASFATINWAAGPYFIKTETDPAGGTNYTITGTQQILSVPYAMYAGKSVNDSAQTAAITAMQAQISALQSQVNFPSIQIGTQQWMQKNLDVVTYLNGDIIPQVTDSTAWAALTTGAWCYYDNDSSNGAIYGKLYNWYAVNDARGLAPQGWHIPTDVEWSTLGTFLGGDAVAGGKMKTTGTKLWTTPNVEATNESGFAGLPGGYRNNDGTFNNVGDFGYWWCATESITANAWYRSLSYFYGNLYRSNDYKALGFSVRCLRD